jgi:NAD(P)-dependent dehydrogenase (short-subunit alcohol dehydrogenase family)
LERPIGNINGSVTMTAISSSPIAEAISGKICLITGGSRTLGAEIARRMARYGAQVVVNYHRSREAALALCEELAAFGGKAQAIQADVSQPGDVERLVSETWIQIGALDMVVNNVGPYADTPFLDLSLADFDRVVAGNVRSTFMMTQAAGRLMKKRGSGHIINIAATSIFHRSHSVYGLAKSGVVHLTEALALELAPEVHVNALAPDLIAENEEMASDFAARAIASTPMGRLVTRGEIAEMVCLLCTPAFAMVAGHTLVLDGGRNIPRIAFGPDRAPKRCTASSESSPLA